MNHWLDIKDVRDMEIDDDKWHKLEIEYDPAFRFEVVKVDYVYWGVFYL